MRLGALVLTSLVVAGIAMAEQAASTSHRASSGYLDGGGSDTCALVTSGALRCWGWGASGRLGYANTASIGDDEVPAAAGPLDLGAGRQTVAVSASMDHACAILDDGSVRCWGVGAQGRLGYGNTTTIGDDETPGSVGPVNLGSGRSAVAIATAYQSTCAILDNGSVRCWGYYAFGQLGLPSAYAAGNSIGDNEAPGSVGPLDLGAGRTAVAITGGSDHYCAVLDDGSVRCWGLGSSGQLGYGNTQNVGDNETPGSVSTVDLGTGRKAVAITAGQHHTCAILDDGSVRCWGLGSSGQLGYGNVQNVGDNETPGSVGPVNLGSGRTAVAISAGEFFTCTVLDDATVRCWGTNTHGELGYANTQAIGDNETPGTAGPVDLGTGGSAVAVSAGFSHTCALLGTGALRCWGWNTHGELGYGNLNNIGDNETPGSAGPVDLGGTVATRAPDKLSLAPKPPSDTTAPYELKATGKLTGLFAADSAVCAGKVQITLKSGSTTVDSAAVKLKPKPAAQSCSYSGALTAPSAGTYSVTASFAGSSNLAPATAPARSFQAG